MAPSSWGVHTLFGDPQIGRRYIARTKASSIGYVTLSYRYQASEGGIGNSGIGEGGVGLTAKAKTRPVRACERQYPKHSTESLAVQAASSLSKTYSRVD